MQFRFSNIERIVIGTLLNDEESKGYFRMCKGALKKEMFSDKQNAFVFGIIEDMNKHHVYSTYPYDVFVFAEKNNIRYGNAQKFCAFMVTLSNEYCNETGFMKSVKELIKQHIVELKRNGKL